MLSYQIHGDKVEFVEIQLKPHEVIMAEAGTILYLDDGIKMSIISGNGEISANNKSFVDKLVGDNKLIKGDGLFVTLFINTTNTNLKVAFASPYPGKIIPVDLKKLGGEIICQRDAFLCASKDVRIELVSEHKFDTKLFGEKGFVMQKLIGSGIALIHAGGSIFAKELGNNQTIRVDASSIVAVQSSIKYSFQTVKSIKNMLFNKDELFLAKVTGPGIIWLQTMPISHLAGEILSRADVDNHDENDHIF